MFDFFLICVGGPTLLRASACLCPSQHGPHTCKGPAVAPSLAEDQIIVNELIREYLQFSGYKHTLSVFLDGPFLAANYSRTTRAVDVEARILY